MKILIAIILLTLAGASYSQIQPDSTVRTFISKTDSDSLWQDFKKLDRDIKKNDYIMFDNDFAWDWGDLPKKIRKKILKRIK